MKRLIEILSIALCILFVGCNKQKTADATMADEAAAATLAANAVNAQNAGTEADSAAVVMSSEGTAEGVLPGAFSVSPTAKVNFAKGNLQYQASTGTWRFAENQYDFLGEENENIDSRYDGWIDLFGWGTSGYNGKAPYMSIVKLSDYGDGAKDIAGTNYDWGVYNAISNGGNKAGIWRTLTEEEYVYLLTKRQQADSLFACATVNDVHGFILLPDGWRCPEGLSFSPSLSKGLTKDGKYYHNDGFDNYTHNVYNAEEWKQLEQSGAVFLPAGGFRYDKKMNYDEGGYWLGSHRTEKSAYLAVFSVDMIGIENWFAIYYGRSVRLVQDVK